MFKLDCRVGRLVEARVFALRSAADADEYTRAIRGSLVGLRPERGIICADHRPVAIYAAPVADRLLELFTTVNPHILRAGLIVAPSNATLSLQLARVVRESSNPMRRVFHRADEMLSWLGETLTDAELTRARAFLTVPRVEPPAP